MAFCHSWFAINLVALSNSWLAFLGSFRSLAEIVPDLPAFASPLPDSGRTLTKTDCVPLRESTSKLSLCVV